MLHRVLYPDTHENGVLKKTRLGIEIEYATPVYAGAESLQTCITPGSLRSRRRQLRTHARCHIIPRRDSVSASRCQKIPTVRASPHPKQGAQVCIAAQPIAPEPRHLRVVIRNISWRYFVRWRRLQWVSYRWLSSSSKYF